jgi:glycosyltransferase involved in cell wall biosynthesis
MFAIGDSFLVRGSLKSLHSRLQDAMSWRVVSWHNSRFRRRLGRELLPHLAKFDSAYVHADVNVASDLARHLPTVLRLPGPVPCDFAPALQKIDLVCANGDALSQVSSFLTQRLAELPIGLDTEVFKPGPTSVRRELGWSDSDLVVGYVGRLTRLKGVDILAKAFRQLSPSEPKLRLLIVGSGEAEPAIRTCLADAIGRGTARIEADVSHDVLRDWYRAMDLFVMPSRYENFSNALLEAMACAVPFMATDIGGNRLLSETGSGWLFQADSVDSLATGIAQRLKVRSALKACGETGSTYVTNRFSWVATAQRLESLIEQIRLSFAVGR